MKLSLSKETLRRLNSPELQNVGGAYDPDPGTETQTTSVKAPTCKTGTNSMAGC
ncbi:MAG: hypothetical protein IPL96_09315 [Holophagaceae bacterium]|nr:hypothetical protein [Holophagaceae bacterium]